MADLTDLQASQSVKLVGAGTTGTESNFASVKSNQELSTSDCANTSGIDSVLSLTTTAQEIKVNASKLSNRKYVMIYALGSNIKWGFNTTCNFDLFKSQFFILPIGNITIYAKTSSGTASLVISELS